MRTVLEARSCVHFFGFSPTVTEIFDQLASADDVEADGLADVFAVEEGLQAVHALDGRAFDGDQDVAEQNAGGFRGAAGGDGDDQQSLVGA